MGACGSSMGNEQAKIEAMAKKIFAKFDSDGSGYIESKDMENVLREVNKQNPKQQLSNSDIKSKAEAFVKNVDKSGDGRISFQEFLPAVQQMLKQQFSKA